MGRHAGSNQTSEERVISLSVLEKTEEETPLSPIRAGTSARPCVHTQPRSPSQQQLDRDELGFSRMQGRASL